MGLLDTAIDAIAAENGNTNQSTPAANSVIQPAPAASASGSSGFGGASLLEGSAELAEFILELPVRRGASLLETLPDLRLVSSRSMPPESMKPST